MKIRSRTKLVLFYIPYGIQKRLRWSRVKRAGLCYPEFAGSNPAEAVGFLEEVEPSVPCLTLRHVKDPKMAWNSSFRLIYWTIFSPVVPYFATRISRVVQTWRYMAAKIGMSKGGGK